MINHDKFNLAKIISTSIFKGGDPSGDFYERTKNSKMNKAEHVANIAVFSYWFLTRWGKQMSSMEKISIN